jgi:ribosome maturation factor RimP
MDAVKRIERIITPSLEAMGYSLVRVRVFGGRAAVLQIMAERRRDGGMNVDDCAEVSRVVSALLDVEDPIHGPYTLEVSSPGIDRPLTRPDDFRRFAGFEARIELARPLEGRKRFKGRLKGLDGDFVRLDEEGAEVMLPLADIAAAKLVLTDELVAWDLKQRAAWEAAPSTES